MPKSGFAANNQAKACGRAILADIAGKAPSPSKLINVCYSTVAPDYAFEIVDDFTVTADTIALTFQNDRTTPLKASDERRAKRPTSPNHGTRTSPPKCSVERARLSPAARGRGPG